MASVGAKREKVGVDQRSPIAAKQYWERQGLPDDWEKKRKEERRLQHKDASYVDPELEDYRQKCWHRRLNGMWFMNDGKPTYITGLYYYYLEWIFIGALKNQGYPSYRESDRKFFYLWRWVEQNPDCFGLVYCTRRREGKTAKSVAVMLEYCTRTEGARGNGGIQSKTEQDASRVVFQEGVLRAFHKLPEFFKPVYDWSKGERQKNDLTFDYPSRGKFKRDREPLGNVINWKSAQATAYDGFKLGRVVIDEIFKTTFCDVRERHNVLKFCVVDTDSNVDGKILCTSTVEEIEGHTDIYKKFWEDSDQKKRNRKTGRTKTGLIRYFLPSDEAKNRDKYGKVDQDANLKMIMAERESYRNDPAEYQSLIRKEPLTINEAFRVSKGQCVYDAVRLNERLDYLGWRKDLYQTGNFHWVDGVHGNDVYWAPAKDGRWKLRYELSEGANKIQRYSDWSRPGNTTRFVIGVDPYDHRTTESTAKRSKGAFYTYMKSDATNPDMSESFVSEYIFRPPTANMFYEDVMKTAIYFGCQVFIENNKPGIIQYFINHGMNPFLMKLPGKQNFGLATTAKVIEDIAALTGDYIFYNIDKVFFTNLVDDWLNFDVEDTRKYDAAMAAGYALMAANINRFSAVRNKEKIFDVDKLFK